MTVEGKPVLNEADGPKLDNKTLTEWCWDGRLASRDSNPVVADLGKRLEDACREALSRGE